MSESRLHLLVIYDRPSGVLQRCEAFDNSGAALRERLDVEPGTDPERVEVVVLSGASFDSIQRTHSRYFRRMHHMEAEGIR